MIKNVFVSTLVILSFIAGAQDKTSSDKTADTTAVIQPAAIPLVDINRRIELTRQQLTDISYDLEYSSEIQAIDSLIKIRDEFLEKEARSFHDYNPHNLSKFFLENTYRAWAGYRTQLNAWKSSVNNSLGKSKDNIAKLNFSRKEWQLTLESIGEANETPELKQRISKVIGELDQTISNFQSKLNKLITLEASITDAMTFSDGIMEDVAKLQQNLRDSLLIAREVPIWKIELRFKGSDHFRSRVGKLSEENAKVFKNYFQSLHVTIYLVIIAILSLLVFLLRRRYFTVVKDSGVRGYTDTMHILKENLYATLFALYIFVYLLMFPYNPLAFTAFLLLIVLISMRYVLAGYTGPTGKHVIWILVGLMVINQFEIVMWYFDDWSRLYIFLETSAVIGASLYILHPNRRKKILEEPPFMRGMINIAYVVFLLGIIAFVANFLGYLDLAVLLLKVAIQSSIVILVIFGLAKVFRIFLISFNTILRSHENKSIQKYLGKIELRSLQLINLLAVIYLFSVVMNILEIRRPVLDYLFRNIEYKWVIGTMTISIGGILFLVLILGITFLISSFLKVLIEEELAGRFKFPKGVPFAISVTIRYFIFILGFVMALSAAGIDLSEFGLIAGALGIGIGFGLQNIVGNFISGLILIYERPVQSGDTVEVGNLMGKVNRIGIRSSNVKTYDGAEVVVPNSNLVSNELINWTLSDNRRRIELKVGVAYGSDPNIVLELLKKVAVDHERVLKEPEPLALFDEFGDSSLNFRLLFWVHFEDGFTTKSDVAIGIYNVFHDNNVTIPFPQVDLHVKDDGKSSKK